MVDAVTAAKVIDRVFEIPEDPEKRMADSDRLHAVNVIDLFTKQSYVGADLAGDTAWGLLNSVTEYVDWHKRARNQGNRLNAAWFGDGANLKQRAMNELMVLAA